MNGCFRCRCAVAMGEKAVSESILSILALETEQSLICCRRTTFGTIGLRIITAKTEKEDLTGKGGDAE